MTVPSTALTSETSSAAPRLSFSAATASGSLITDQKPCVPSLCADQTSAAIGSTTMIERKAVTKPSERAVAAPSLG